MTLETANRNRRVLRWFTQYARAAGAAAVVIGALALLGWLLDVGLLKGVLAGKATMKPNTAICFVLAGAALLWLGLAPGQQRVVSGTRRRWTLVAATLVAVIGLATLCEYLLGVNLGIDNLLFRNSLLATADSGRMAAATALNFSLLGGALLVLDERHRIAHLCAELSAMATLLVGLIALLGYIYGIESLYSFYAYNSMALHTALLFVLLGLGVLFSRPERGLITVITSEHGGSMMARRILPVAVFLPVALGWLRLKGEQAGLYRNKFGLALLVASTVMVLVLWVWISARWLNALDARRQRSEESTRKSQTLFRRLFEGSPDAVLLVQADGGIARVNQQAVALFGYNADELTGQPVDVLLPKRFRAAHVHLRATYAAAPTMRLMGEGRELFALRRDGTEFATEISLSPVETEDGPMTLCVVRDVTERKRMESERQAIFEIIQGVSTSANLDSLLQLIHQAIQKVLYAENCFVALSEENTGMLNMRFFVDQRDPVPSPQKVGRGRTGYVFRMGWPILMTSEVFETLAEQGEIESIGTPPAAWLGVPLNSLSKTIGVLVVQHYEDDKAYSERDLEFLSSVGGQIAVAIERKRAEVALRESEEHYRDLFEGSVMGSDISTVDGTILACNAAFARIFGFASVAEVMQSKAVSLYKDAKDRDRFIELLRRERRLENYEMELRRLDGRTIHVSENVDGVFDESGELVELHSHLIDITDRRQAEAERARLLNVLEASLNELYVFGPNTLRFEYVNAGACRNLGYTLDALRKMTPLDLKPEFTEASFREMINPLLRREKEKHVFFTVHRRADGSLYPVEVHLQLVELSDTPTFLAVILDITERKQAEEALRASEAQLRQSQKLEAVGQLAGGIAHDFNNLLTAINGYSSLALKRLGDASPVKSYIEEVKKAGDRAANLTRQLLAFSRKQILEPKVLDLNEVVGDMSKMLRRVIGEDVELATRLASELGRVKADPGPIEQIIMNLVVNARDALPTGGKVTIETADVFLDDEYAREHFPTEPGPYVMLAISDTGMGMDAETQARIFEPFFTTKELGKGTGLGLSTVYGIVKQSNGFVWVYSEPGCGTTFKIYLPQVDAEKTTKAKLVAEAACNGSETILLVEDEDVVRKLAREVLEDAGYNVLEADCGEEAIRLCTEYTQEVHLLLSDVVMPGTSGKEIAERLVSLRPEMKVLFMSGYTDEAIVHHGVLDSGVKFLQKPFSPAALSRKVREVLDSN